MDSCSVEERGDEYLVIVDYCSRYFLAERLRDTNSMNGPQFTSEQFKGLVKEQAIIQRTSAPKYAQSNGEAERGVQIFKRLIAKNSNIDRALLCFRNIPPQNGY